MAIKDFKAAVSLVNNNKPYPAATLVSQSPDTAALISKLISTTQRSDYDGNQNRTLERTSRTSFDKVSKEIISKSQDAESVMEMFPEMELAKQILVSSVISPKDMSNGDIIYTAPQSILTSEINATLINKIREYFETVYKIKPLLPKILKETLFGDGSYPIAVIPENSLDDMINNTATVSNESLSVYQELDGTPKHSKILGDPRITKESKQRYGISLEAFQASTPVSYDASLTESSDGKFKTLGKHNLKIVDNFNILKIPRLARALEKRSIKAMIASNSKVSLESGNLTRLSDSQMTALVYKNKTKQTKNVIKIKTSAQSSRKTIGRPLIMKLPSEAVIPVHVPGNEQEHIGYFVLLDGEGNPVNKNTRTSGFSDLQSTLKANSDLSNSLMARAKQSLGTQPDTLTIDQATKIYTDIIETDLSERLRTGIYGKFASVSRNEEVYRIMMARALANQATQLLYVPAELLTYFAYRYDNNGVGKSLLDSMRLLNSLRAIMMFSRVMASVKNSIGRTNVKLKLDEKDPDPQKTIETSIHEISKTNQQYFPLGLNSPADLVDWIGKSGFQYNFEGHPGIPDVNFEFSESSTSYVKPDEDLDNELKKRSIQATGLPPEAVDNGFSAEFATTVVSNNLLLAKNVSQIQEAFTPQITQHGRQIITNDGNIMGTIREIISENYDKIKDFIGEDEDLKDVEQETVVNFLAESFANGFELSLPMPNSIRLENQMKSFDIYAEGLDKALDAWVNTSILNADMVGDLSNEIDNIKAIIKAYYLRKYMADNNLFTELADLTSNDENGNPSFDFAGITSDHISALVRSGVKLMDKTNAMKIAANKDLTRITGGEGVDATSTGDDAGSDDTQDTSTDDESLDDAPPSDSGDDSTTDTPEDGGDEGGTDDSDPTDTTDDLPPIEKQ